MASPAALIGIAYFAVIFTQVCSSPFWSQPDCPDQGQSGHWSGSGYDNQGPSYQQTLQAMVTETIRCIQQVIQVTKREMNLLLRQLAQDEDCKPPPGNTQGDFTPGQIQFPPPDSGYNYDRPQEQLQYPAQYQPSGPLVQPPRQPQVQIHYQLQVQPQPQYLPDSRPLLDTDSDRPQEQLQYPAQYQPSDSPIQSPLQPQVQIHYQLPEQLQNMPQTQSQSLPDSRPLMDTDLDRPQDQLQYPAQQQPSDPLVQTPLQPQVQIHYQPQAQFQDMPQTQPQYLAGSRPLLNTDSYIVNCSYENADFNHEVPSSTVENKIYSSETHETSPASSENTSAQPQIHTGSVERPIKMENTTSNTALEGIQVQSGNGFVPLNSTVFNAGSNTIALSHSNSSTATEAIMNIDHDSIIEYNVTSDSTPTVLSTNFTMEQAITTTTEKTPNGAIEDSVVSDLTDIPILIHGALVTIPKFTSTTAINYNTIDHNFSDNMVTIPSPMNNEVDVNMENLTHIDEIINTNKFASSNATTLSTPIEQTPSNNTEINMVILSYNNSGDSTSTDGNGSGSLQNMASEKTTNTVIEFSTFGNWTNETTIETTRESESTTEEIDKHNELQNVTTTNSTVATVSVRQSKL